MNGPSEITIAGDVALVSLGDAVARIDIGDIGKVSPFYWRRLRRNNSDRPGYAVAKTYVNGQRILIYMHRLLIDAPKGMEVDHIDGDGLNNTRENLRLATRQQNLANTRISRTNKSGYKGVSWDSVRNKWTAHIEINGRSINLGRFSEIQDAVAAYQSSAKNLFGQFARFK